MTTVFNIVVILLFCCLLYADEKLRNELAMNKQLLSKHEELKQRLEKTSQDYKQLKLQQKKDLESAIKYSLSRCRIQQDKEELLEIIIDHLWYVGEINNVTDFFKYDIKYIIKVCTCAEECKLDYYQKSDGNEGE